MMVVVVIFVGGWRRILLAHRRMFCCGRKWCSGCVYGVCVCGVACGYIHKHTSRNEYPLV